MQFYCADEELIYFLDEYAKEFGRQTVLWARLEKVDKRFEKYETLFDLKDCLSAEVSRLARYGKGSGFLVVPEELAGLLKIEGRQENAFLVNGAMCVQHGRTRNGQRLSSRISIFSQVKNITTGDVQKLNQAFSRFDWMRSVVKRELCYKTIKKFPDGHQEELDDSLMTGRAAELAKMGFFDREVGGAVRGI